MPFILDINNFLYTETDSKGFNTVFTSTMNEKQAEDFLTIQDFASNEITQEITKFTREGLIVSLPLRDESLLFLLVYDQDNLIAYGYSHNDTELKSASYVNTIYVSKNYRGRGLSKFILDNLIHKNVERDASLRFIKGVTQPDNNEAIRLLTNKGFIYQND